MAKLSFNLPSPLDQQATFDKIHAFLNSEHDFKKFDPSVKCEFVPAEKHCQIKGSQFTAHLKVLETEKLSGKASVQVDVEVGFALSLIKGKIQDVLEKTFKKVLKS